MGLPEDYRRMDWINEMMTMTKMKICQFYYAKILFCEQQEENYLAYQKEFMFTGKSMKSMLDLKEKYRTELNAIKLAVSMEDWDAVKELANDKKDNG